MKAVLVIELPVALDYLIGEEMLLYISHKDGRYIMTEYALLRPLPKKRIVLEHRIGGYIVNGLEMTEAHGWNACIEELLETTRNYSKQGETE